MACKEEFFLRPKNQRTFEAFGPITGRWLGAGKETSLPLLHHLKRLLGAARQRPPTYLAQEEALSLAGAALAARDPGADGSLFVENIRQDADGLTWIVRTASVGSWWVAEVSDKTGAVTALRRHGIR